MKFLLAVILLPSLLLSACGQISTPLQGVAEEFVDQHYVNFDLQKAKHYTVSVAQAKINEEIRLTTGQQIDASTQKPRVNYSLLEKKESETGRRTYSKDDSIRRRHAFTRKWLIATRVEGNQWRVFQISPNPINKFGLTVLGCQRWHRILSILPAVNFAKLSRAWLGHACALQARRVFLGLGFDLQRQIRRRSLR